MSIILKIFDQQSVFLKATCADILFKNGIYWFERLSLDGVKVV